MAGSLGVRYDVVVEGVSKRRILDEIKNSSDAIYLKSSPPASLNLLRKRAKNDTARFLKVLKAQGYYAAYVEVDIDAEESPVQVKFRIETGPPYLLKSARFQIRPEEAGRSLTLPQGQELGLVLDKPLRSRDIINAQKTLLQHIRRQGFPFPKVSDRQIIIDNKKHCGSVYLLIDSGPRAFFGKTGFSGLESVDEAFIRDRIPWKQADPYNADLVAQFQNRLTELALFATVSVTTGKSLDEKNQLPVTVVVRERKHRSIGAGINYKTDEGPGVKLSWENRNLLHRGERMTLSSNVSAVTRDFESGFRKPCFMQDNQLLKLSVRVATDQPDAYLSRNIKSSALVDRKLDKTMVIGAGLGFKSSKVTQVGKEEHFKLIFIPAHFDADSSDNLLDPTRGGRLFLQLAPYYDIMGSNSNFVREYASYRHYITVSKDPLFVLAGKISLGAIEGGSVESIPADERFYAGGSGSVRGYAYQYVGPLKDGKPMGGKSLFEFSAELRLKLSDDFGIVGFLDGGSAFADTIPDSGQALRWGTGMGFRYYTPIGPLRFDVGFPLNRRPNIDDSFQLYVSLGQTF